MNYTPLFQPISVGPLRLKNRFVMAPMSVHMTEDGSVSDAEIAYTERRAMGGVSMIIVGSLCIWPDGNFGGQIFIHDDGCIPGLDDSKKLTEKKREALFDVICQQAAAWAVASVSAEEIDATDILSARMKAMQLAIDALAIPADHALIDGNRDHGRSSAITTPHETVVGGDGRSASIAAASVLAKVSRDRYVCRVLDPLYPQYQFARHKGYGTKLHYAMLDRYGPCPEHRMSFLTKWKERHT